MFKADDSGVSMNDFLIVGGGKWILMVTSDGLVSGLFEVVMQTNPAGP